MKDTILEHAYVCYATRKNKKVSKNIHYALCKRETFGLDYNIILLYYYIIRYFLKFLNFIIVNICIITSNSAYSC